MAILKLVFGAWLIYCASAAFDPILTEIGGYHFHTYFFHTNPNSLAEATEARERVIDAVASGLLAGCEPGILHLGPIGPHTVSQFVTCCNSTAHSRATSWFMQNRGNLTVLLHALTRYEVADHFDRAMFIGPSIRLDPEILEEDLGNDVPNCNPSSVNDDWLSHLSELPAKYKPYH